MTDKICPFVEYLFDNLLKTTTGAYKCNVQGIKPEDANLKTFDYPTCNNKSGYEECSVFQKNNKLENKTIN